MFDVERFKVTLQCDIDKREEAFKRLTVARSSGDMIRIAFCQNRYQKYKYRVQGMEDILYETGYLVLELESGVRLIERCDYDK